MNYFCKQKTKVFLKIKVCYPLLTDHPAVPYREVAGGACVPRDSELARSQPPPPGVPSRGRVWEGLVLVPASRFPRGSWSPGSLHLPAPPPPHTHSKEDLTEAENPFVRFRPHDSSRCVPRACRRRAGLREKSIDVKMLGSFYLNSCSLFCVSLLKAHLYSCI